MAENNKYHIYQKANGIKLRDLLPLIRGATYSNYDELGTVVLCPECEEWTWVEMNISNCLFEQLGDLIVEEIDADGDRIRLWIKTDEFNWFKPKEE